LLPLLVLHLLCVEVFLLPYFCQHLYYILQDTKQQAPAATEQGRYSAAALTKMQSRLGPATPPTQCIATDQKLAELNRDRARSTLV
jgi:hypothetical protein